MTVPLLHVTFWGPKRGRFGREEDGIVKAFECRGALLAATGVFGDEGHGHLVELARFDEGSGLWLVDGQPADRAYLVADLHRERDSQSGRPLLVEIDNRGEPLTTEIWQHGLELRVVGGHPRLLVCTGRGPAEEELAYCDVEWLPRGQAWPEARLALGSLSVRPLPRPASASGPRLRPSALAHH